MQIAYIELDTHAELVRSFHDILQQSERVNVHFYLSEKVRELSGIPWNEQVIRARRDTIIKCLHAKKFDLIIIGTVHRNFNLYHKITAQFPTALIVHNRNFALAKPFQLLKSIRKDSFYRLKLGLKEGLLSAPLVYRTAKVQFVLSPELVDNRSIYLPMFFTQNLLNTNEERLRIVVPGSVSHHRRDYAHILGTLQNFTQPATVVFLGKAQGDELEMIRKFQKQKADTVSLTYYTEKVPAEVFAEEMQRAHLLWCRVQRETSFFGIKEEYGRTKFSGNVADAIRYGKPAVFSSGTAPALPFIFDEEKEVEAQFYRLRRMHHDFSSFRKEEVRRRMEEVLLSINQ